MQVDRGQHVVHAEPDDVHVREDLDATPCVDCFDAELAGRRGEERILCQSRFRGGATRALRVHAPQAGHGAEALAQVRLDMPDGGLPGGAIDEVRAI
jgi:hypothetical protein